MFGIPREVKNRLLRQNLWLFAKNVISLCPNSPYVYLYMKHIAFSFILMTLLFCSCGSNGRSSESRQACLDGRVVTDEGEANTTKSEITAEMAYEGVSNYCHSAYDWSIAKDNPSIMYVKMGEETDSAYQVVFRSYTGAFVNFYVDKTSGTTRMEEYVPALDVRNDAGTIDIFDYLEQKQ